MKIKTSDLFPSTFNQDFKDVFNHVYTEYTEYGGRGSCKSTFISICITLLIMKNKDFNALILRKTANSLRNSVFEQMKWAIDKLNVNHLFRFTVSPMQAVYIPTGQVILFSGVDDPTRLKSLKVKHGYFAITWFEESSEFSPEETENVKLTTMRGGDTFYIFDSFNPPSSVRNWKNEDVRKPKTNRLCHLSDYRTTPSKWLGDAFIFEAEEMQKSNERAYRNIFLGEATGSGSNVFENIEIREISQKEIDSFEYIYNGVDFGYFPDPFVFQKMAYDMKNETLYIFAELKLFKHGNYEASEKLKDYLMDFNKSDFESYKKIHRNYSPEVIAKQYLLEIMNERITADSAEPKSVADFRNYGWNMKGAVKGKGSLEAGFKWLQSRKKIVIDPLRCPEAADEFSLYEYDIDKRTGEIMEGYPQGQKDHSLAACRYAMEEVWNRKGM